MARVRESARGGHIWLRDLKSSQVTPTALTVFTMMFALVPLPSQSLSLFLSLSFCLYFSFLLLCLPSPISLFFLFFLKSRLSIPLLRSLSLSDAFTRDLGRSYANRNRIFFVAPRPKIPVVVQPWVKRRGSYTAALYLRDEDRTKRGVSLRFSLFRDYRGLPAFWNRADRLVHSQYRDGFLILLYVTNKLLANYCFDTQNVANNEDT